MTTPPPLPSQPKKKTILPDFALAASVVLMILTVFMDIYIFKNSDNPSLKNHFITYSFALLSSILWTAALGLTIGSLITTAKSRTIPLFKTALSFVFLFFSIIGLVIYGIIFCYYLRMSL